MNVCSRIRDSQPERKITCEIYHGQEVIDRKSRFKSLGFDNRFDNPSGWENEITREEAIAYLTEILSTHLDSDRELMERPKALELAELFISSIPNESKIYSNCYYNGPEPLSLKRSTFKHIENGRAQHTVYTRPLIPVNCPEPLLGRHRTS